MTTCPSCDNHRRRADAAEAEAAHLRLAIQFWKADEVLNNDEAHDLWSAIASIPLTEQAPDGTWRDVDAFTIRGRAAQLAQARIRPADET